MTEKYANDFFVANRFILRRAGLWPLENKNPVVQILYAIYHVTSLSNLIFVSAATIILLWELFGKPHDFLKCASIFLVSLMTVCKSLFFTRNGNKLKEMMETLETKDFHYEDCPERDFYPGVISKQYKERGIKSSIGFLYLTYLSIVLNYIAPIFALLTHVLSGETSENKLPKELPYYMWVPFRYDTVSTYSLALVYEGLTALSVTFCAVGMDTLFMNLLYSINLQLTLLQGAFLTVRERAAKRTERPLLTDDSLHNSEALRKHLNQEMCKVIRHQQTIYKVCADFEYTYSHLALGQFGSTLFTLCACLYLVSLQPVFGHGYFYELVYLVLMVMELFLYCWFGNQVTVKAGQLYMSIWQCDWLTADADFKRSMILSMQRAQQPLHFKAGKLVPLTLDTFVQIIRKSYSIFTVIKTMGPSVEQDSGQ